MIEEISKPQDENLTFFILDISETKAIPKTIIIVNDVKNA